VIADQFVAETSRAISSKKYEQTQYVDQVLLPRSPGFARSMLKDSVSRVGRQRTKANGPTLWEGLPPISERNRRESPPKRR
jgi:hypothetical protein